MKVPSADIGRSDVVNVRRLRSGRGRQPDGEVLVTFADVDTRDRICSYARNLGPFVDADGKPTAGVRMYVRTHLGGVHKTLLQYGHNMRQKHGQDFKRNIRFEDAELSLAIDIKLPGKSSKWVTVSYPHALADRRAWSDAVVSRNLDRLSSRPDAENPVIEIDAPGTELAASRLDGLPGTRGHRSSTSSTSSGGLNGQTEQNAFAGLSDDPSNVWTAPRK